eukprot:TRINITY_DN13014_c0_g1_i1.p1 TRINITY_DN13014_c0_g1~~TRINITY_DN13014_c0_g1_i1.p1  ORF type:complete len:210 (+),score=16.69 TRINITY_DN13014_c0_g1_i1:196-825(+)
MTAMTVLSVGYWFVVTVLVVYGAKFLIREVDFITMRIIGLFFALSLLICGVVAVLWKHTPAPKGKKKVPVWIYPPRAVLAALVNFTAVALSPYSETAAGTASVFPAIFLTAMIALRLSQGVEVTSGAVGPLMLGALSLDVFSMVLGETYVYISTHYHSLEGWAAIIIAECIAYSVAISCVSYPVYLFLSYVDKRAQERAVLAPQPLIEE